jgi:uncharacterized protein (DUF58 family)
MPRTDYRTFLKPETVSRLKGMELKARMVVEGFMTGLHKSPYHGFSVEFAEHRQYMPGDSIRDIDWKVFAKSDRYYIKQYEEETNLKAYVLLDCSASMGYTSGSITKFMYGQTLAAALSYLMLRQRDAVGLVTFDDKINRYIPPRGATGQLHVLLEEFARLEPQSLTDFTVPLHEMAERIRRRGLVIVISDLFDDPNTIISGLKHFRHRRHEVIVFQILDPRERDFGFSGEAIFEDMETGEKITTQPWQIKRDYVKQFSSEVERITSECRQANVDYYVIDTSTPFDKALYAFLSKRERLY